MEEKRTSTVKGGAKWKEVVVGGVSGIALGVAGTLFASATPSDASAVETDNAEGSDDTAANNSAIAPMATKVEDSMSFSDAFNVARAEVGSGGTFEWHGNLYSTYTADEWANMDTAAREQFAERIHWDGPSHEYVASNSHHSSHSPGNDTANEYVHQASHDNSYETNTHTATHTTTTHTQGTEDPEVEIIGVEHANIDGEHDSIIGAASINGQAVYFVDVDGEDDEFEIMMADTNGNSQVDDDEIIDISEQHMSVSNFEQLAQTNNQGSEESNPETYYASNEDLPDYVNDVDPGTLA